eukprot:2648392-Amphidinium_carterae.1
MEESEYLDLSAQRPELIWRPPAMPTVKETEARRRCAFLEQSDTKPYAFMLPCYLGFDEQNTVASHIFQHTCFVLGEVRILGWGGCGILAPRALLDRIAATAQHVGSTISAGGVSDASGSTGVPSRVTVPARPTAGRARIGWTLCLDDFCRIAAACSSPDRGSKNTASELSWKLCSSVQAYTSCWRFADLVFVTVLLRGDLAGDFSKTCAMNGAGAHTTFARGSRKLHVEPAPDAAICRK